MQRQHHLRHPALVPLWKSLEKDWLLQLTVKLVVLVIALILLAVGMNANPAIFILGSVLTVAGSWLTFRHFRQKGTLEKLQDRLYDDPGSVVWIYTIVLEHHPFGLQIHDRGLIYFKFDDGDEVSAYLPPRKLRMITKVLHRALPYTVFGYTKERAEQYKKDPMLISKWQL